MIRKRPLWPTLDHNVATYRRNRMTVWERIKTNWSGFSWTWCAFDDRTQSTIMLSPVIKPSRQIWEKWLTVTSKIWGISWSRTSWPNVTWEIHYRYSLKVHSESELVISWSNHAHWWSISEWQHGFRISLLQDHLFHSFISPYPKRTEWTAKQPTSLL